MLDPHSFAIVFLAAIPFLLRLNSVEKWRSDKEDFEEQMARKFEAEIYDFIVVGAGTAGCVIASRLSEKYRVLLLEAGGSPPQGIEMPALFRQVSIVPEINYFYTSLPQAGADNRTFTKTMGKMMGGTNSHNSLVHNRGHSLDYDNWANITRDESWKYEKLLKLFKMSENYVGIFANDQHGRGGPLTITTDYRHILPVWMKAAHELGYKTGDPNGPQFEGFTATEVARRLGRRASTYTAYISTIRKSRQNLKINKYANVTKILFNSSTGNTVAVGVNYTRHGVQFTALARKEIVLSAGVFGSPMLLFKSGIGPFEMLQEAKISPLVADLPVGENLQDHPAVILGPFTINDLSKLSTPRNNLTESHFQQFIEFKDDGVLSSTGVGPQAFFVSSLAKRKGQSSWPDIQIQHVDSSFGGSGKFSSSTESDGPPGLNEFSLTVFVGRPDPKYAGSVKLDTKAFLGGIQDDTQLALIEYNFMKSPDDYEVLLEAIHLAMRIFQSETFRALNTSLVPFSECTDKHTFNSTAYWDCYIRQKGDSSWHSTGTCRMGYGPEDKKAVIDSKFRVLGVKNLRVADASIMPDVTNSNTNAPVVLIGEKAAFEILATHENSR